MAAEKATALVLRVIDFSETSAVVTLFTREFGKVRALAKGARRPKGPFEAALDLLALCRIVFLRKSSDVLDLLTEAKLERRFRIPGRDLSRLYAAYYVAELLDELTDDHDPHPELFDAAAAALAALAEADRPVGELVLRFEFQALRVLGHAPSLDACAECGAELPDGPRVAFGLLSGGVLCVHCRQGKKQVATIRDQSLAVLRRSAEPQANAAVALDRAASGEIRGVMNQYICNLLGKRPRMHQYLGILSA